MEYDYEYFKKEIFDMTGINLSQYKEKQMKRRINTLMERSGIDGYENYIRILKTDRERFDYFVGYITINVSEFFRTPEHWSYVEEELLPVLAEKYGGSLKIWSAACATGEEPYSLAMSLSRYLPLEEIHIMATDIDMKALNQAKKGVYSEKSVSTVPEDFRRSFFRKEGENYVIEDKLKDCITFSQHNLLSDPYPQDCNLILCRNVLIYFTDDAKNLVFSRCRESLKEGGYLFTGNTEQLINYKKMGYMREKTFLYCK